MSLKISSRGPSAQELLEFRFPEKFDYQRFEKKKAQASANLTAEAKCSPDQSFIAKIRPLPFPARSNS